MAKEATEGRLACGMKREKKFSLIQRNTPCASSHASVPCNRQLIASNLPQLANHLHL